MADAVVHPSAHTTEEAQDERRKQIREIMKDPSLSQTEKNRTIQSLMDGRRRSSAGTRSVCSNATEGTCSSVYASNMAGAAAAAAEFYNSDSSAEDGDVVMMDDDVDRPDNIYSYNYDRDDRSNSSEVTYSSHISLQPNTIPQGTSYRQVHGRSYSLQDWNDNDRGVAATSTIFHNNPAALSRLMENSRPACQHYQRNCTIVSPCCGLAFGCRICHDECPVLPPPLALRKTVDCHATTTTTGGGGALMRNNSRRRSMPLQLSGSDGVAEEESHHLIDRFAIREVICRECCTRQSSKTNRCISCNVSFGEYHCSICNLWMSASENPYHCNDCGFCRVGGRENFCHCHCCGMCIDAAAFDSHNCKSGKYMSNCPICQEDLFSSRHASHEMPCGHAIHWHCFRELTSYDTRCPVCKKTAETPEQMASTWSAIAMGIAMQPVPEDMARLVNIFCNDCEERDEERRWHFLGVRCNHCTSFNTNVEQIVMHGRDAAAYLDQLEASREQTNGVPSSIVTPSSVAPSAATADPDDDGDDAMEEDNVNLFPPL